jgi:nitric oxide reductase large subunit
MPDLINAIIIVVFAVGVIVITGTLLFLGWYQLSNTRFYARWQAKRRERMVERFVADVKRMNKK